jgi:peptidoglycan/LPS O-acetylase OafA/YrhL
MPRHLPVLDGLRGIAVLLVMWCHVPTSTPGYPEWLGAALWLIGPGSLGVEIFFVLSGFLITRILLAERARGTPLRWFLLRRACRIFPIYYLFLLVMLPSQPLSEIGWCAVYLHNLDAILRPHLSPFSHTWSLCVEEHFYLLWPPVVTFCKPATSARVIKWLVMPFALICALVIGITVRPDLVMNAVQHNSLCRFFSLGAGCLLALHEGALFERHRGRSVVLACFATALLMHPMIHFLFGPYYTETIWLPPETGQGVWLIHSGALATGIVTLGIVGGRAKLSPMRLLTLPPLRAVGRISYGLYLYHWPIYFATVWFDPTPAKAATAIGATFAVATASYWAIERPILRYASRFRGAVAPPA